MTWRDLALVYPGFVQWLVQKHGPLPDGPVLEEDYNRFKAEYEVEMAEFEAELCTKCWHPNLPMEPVDHTGPCPSWTITLEQAAGREDAIRSGHFERSLDGGMHTNSGHTECLCGERFTNRMAFYKHMETVSGE